MWCQTCRKDECRPVVVALQFVLLLLHSILFVFSSILFIWGCIAEGSNKLGSFRLSNIIVSTPSSILIIFGGAVVISSLLGLIGNCIGKFWLIRWSIFFALLLIMVDLLMGIWIFFCDDALSAFTNLVTKSMNDYNLDGALSIGLLGHSPNEYWDKLQLNGNCCGMNSYKDWFPTRMGRNDDLPSSCCKTLESSCGKGILVSLWLKNETNLRHEYLKSIYQEGCFQNQQEIILSQSKKIGAIGLAIGVILNITIVLAVVLAFVEQLKHRKPIYTFKQLIRSGIDTRVGFEDLNAYKVLAKRYQSRKREEYFDQTGGVLKRASDFHPGQVAKFVKQWARKSNTETNANATSTTSTKVRRTNSNDGNEKMLGLCTPIEPYDGPIQVKRIRRV